MGPFGAWGFGFRVLKICLSCESISFWVCSEKESAFGLVWTSLSHPWAMELGLIFMGCTPHDFAPTQSGYGSFETPETLNCRTPEPFKPTLNPKP